MSESWETEKEAALDRNSRFIEGFVEELNVCPYAKRSRLTGTARRFITPAGNEQFGADHPDVAEAFAAVAENPETEVVQLICPRIVLTGKDWASHVKGLTEELHQRHGRSVVGVAAFHPELSFREDRPAALVPLFRRAPDPTIQWIRLDAIERVRAGRPMGDIALPGADADLEAFLQRQRLPSVEAEISAANARTVDELGLEMVLRMLDGYRK